MKKFLVMRDLTLVTNEFMKILFYFYRFRKTISWRQNKVLKSSKYAQDFFMLLRKLIDKLDSKDLKRLAVTSWAIWNARNKLYFKKAQFQKRRIAEGAVGLLHCGLFCFLFLFFFFLFGYVFPRQVVHSTRFWGVFSCIPSVTYQYNFLSFP